MDTYELQLETGREHEVVEAVVHSTMKREGLLR